MSAKPLLLDHRGELIRKEPRARLSDMQAERRAIRARYDSAATTGENTRHWANADSLGPNSALDPETRRIIRDRARYEIANDTFASGMIDTLANDTIGTGPSIQVLSGDKKADSEVELAFWYWTQATRLAQKLRTMRKAKAGDGESFATMFTNPMLRDPVRLDIRTHEAEMIANPAWSLDVESLTDGIIFDDFGNVTAYTLLTEHPGEQSPSGVRDHETIQAMDMLHLFDQDRPGQARGCSEIAPALPLYAMRRRYALATLRGAELAAMLSWLMKTQSPPDDPDLAEPFDPIDMERGMGMTLPAGWEAFQLKPEQPTNTYEEFTKAIIREIARCLNMPFNVAAGDSSAMNYSSGRLDYKNYAKAIRVERSYWEVTALDPLFARWWAEARLVRGLLPESIRASRFPPSHQWRWDGDEHIDPVKEAAADKINLEIGATTLADIYSKKGQDWEDRLNQRAKEVALAKQLGLVEPPPTSQVPTTDTEDEEDPDDEEGDDADE